MKKLILLTIAACLLLCNTLYAAAPDASRYTYIGEQDGLYYYSEKGSLYRSTIRDGQGIHYHGGHSAIRYRILIYAPSTDWKAIVTSVIDLPCALYAETDSKIYDAQGGYTDGPSFDIDLLQPIPYNSVHGVIYKWYTGR